MREQALLGAAGRILGLLLVVTGLAGCSLPARAPAPQLYDFGPAVPPAAAPAAASPMLALRVQASPALDSPAMLYRLNYADARQLRSYSQARWAMLPSELVERRLRGGLASSFTLAPGEAAPRVLHLDIDEFSQQFQSADASRGVLRLRASLLRSGSGAEQVLAQREYLIERPAPGADAAGGVQALAAATDAAVTELVQWLKTVP